MNEIIKKATKSFFHIRIKIQPSIRCVCVRVCVYCMRTRMRERHVSACMHVQCGIHFRKF